MATRTAWQLVATGVGAVTLVHLVWSSRVLYQHAIRVNDYDAVFHAGRRAHLGDASMVQAVPPTIDRSMAPPRRLRWDWTSLERLSPLARRIVEHQGNCSVPLATFRYRNRFGLGSDLHVYSQALCNTLETGTLRVRTALPWHWLDEQACQLSRLNHRTTSTSAMTCYFPEAELACPHDRQLTEHQLTQLVNLTRGRGRLSRACPTILAQYGVSAMRAATTEFLLTRVSPLIQREAERQWDAVFRNDTTNERDGSAHRVPAANLITVHIRWGDKADEMTLVPIQHYIEAVQQLIQQRQDETPDWMSRGVHIFCATEDPRAWAAFQAACPRSWNIYIDQYYSEMLPHRRDVYNGSPLMARDLSGRPGVVALGSLLVAMEANSFVLTTSSNWSRLMNELRRNVLDPRCNNCTRWIDLSPGEW